MPAAIVNKPDNKNLASFTVNKNIGPVINKMTSDNKTGPSDNKFGDITNIQGRNIVNINDKNNNNIND